jgi:Trypsin
VTGKPFPAESFVVLAGASSLTETGISSGPTVQARLLARARIHPQYNPAAGAGAPDDIGVLELANPLTESSAVKPIGLPPSVSAPPEGAEVLLSGYGQENPSTEELNGRLYALEMGLVFSRRCGGEADALFLCASTPGGSACNGDSGGPVVAGRPSTLVGIVDIVFIAEGQRCRFGAVNGFVNLAAPEVRDFIEGNETPPLAPRGGGVVIEGVTVAGHQLSCRPGNWSNGPAFTYAFINGVDNQVLLQGASSSYLLSEADRGRTIFCQVQASNAGGTGIARTVALAPVRPAPAPPAPGVGGVLSSTSASISVAQIEALLEQQLRPSGKGAKIAALLKRGGLTITLEALEPGTAAIDWYQLAPGGKLSSANARPVLVAAGQISFSVAGPMKLKIRLTATGRRLLKHRKRLKLTAVGKFTPLGGAPITATRAFVLRR